MKQLLFETGGRPPMNDDFSALQELITMTGGGALLRALPACVLNGCQVTPAAAGKYNVAKGFVWLPGVGLSGLGGIYNFEGATNVDLPATFVLGAAQAIDQRPYETGGTKTCISDTQAQLESVAAGAAFAVDAEGPVLWYDHVAARTRAVGDIVMGMYDLSGYDPVTFVGRGRNRGWALCYGQTVNGVQVADMRGLVPVGYNPDNAAYSQRPLGTTGGTEEHTLTLAQMPDHQHQTQTVALPGPINNGDALSKTDATNGGSAQGYTKYLGGAQPRSTEAHNNMPPFRVLVYRQWLGL